VKKRKSHQFDGLIYMSLTFTKQGTEKV
jgi:hypothetical protein